jgi:hypothetical protein
MDVTVAGTPAGRETRGASSCMQMHALHSHPRLDRPATRHPSNDVPEILLSGFAFVLRSSSRKVASLGCLAATLTGSDETRYAPCIIAMSVSNSARPDVFRLRLARESCLQVAGRPHRNINVTHLQLTDFEEVDGGPI